MTYAVVFDVPGSLELYQAAHTEFNKYPTDDLLVHIGRPTGDGVQVVEVWTSEEAFHGLGLAPAVSQRWVRSPPQDRTLPEVTPTPFDPAGMVLPTASITV